MDSRPLLKKLQSLLCHFTWRLEIKDKVHATHILQTVACQIQHTPYRNHGTLLALKAYLHHLQGSYREALCSLQEAENALKQDHPTNFSRQVLVIYGDYAWVYYRLSNYDLVEQYLSQIYKVCHALSCPEPYSALIPEVQAQEGWSLLAVGFRNGVEAESCFSAALRGDPSNMEFQAGLAISAFASWTHSWTEDNRDKAKRLVEDLMETEDDVLKVYLANLLRDMDLERANQLIDEVVQKSLNPEVLRNAARVCKILSPSQAISILQRAIALNPDYHLLHFDLGNLYMRQMKGASPEEKGKMVAAAMESIKQAVELDPESIFPRLKLAELYGEQTPAYAEEMYLNLLEDLPQASLRCQQAIYLHWGDFLQRKGLKSKALEMYKAGFVVLGGHPWEQRQLKERLMNMARMFQKDMEADRAQSIYRFLQTMGNPS